MAAKPEGTYWHEEFQIGDKRLNRDEFKEFSDNNKIDFILVNGSQVDKEEFFRMFNALYDSRRNKS